MPTLTLDDSPVTAALQAKGLPALRHIHVEETETGVTLNGVVTSYYLKQVAQESIVSLLNGRKLHNRLRVVRG